MDTFPLTTKIQIPPHSEQIVVRARLIKAIEEAIPHRRLFHISAPAGYGKTTLLAEWAHISNLKVTWLSLSQDDNDLDHFFRYLFSAWERIQLDIADSKLAVLLEAISPDLDAVLKSFINYGNQIHNHTVFVLDDYHLIKLDSIDHAMSFLIDHLPPNLHFILSGRSEPSLPIARYRARNQLFELELSDLQFQLEESTLYLNEQMNLDLARDDIVNIHNQVEGWIAGLHLAAIALQRNPELTIDSIAGTHRFIADYLREDVLSHLSEDTRNFLLQTSILDRFNAGLCNAVTSKKNGQEILEYLERENLFLVALDNHRDWYRYHQLFSDYLVEELQHQQEDQSKLCHRRASEWFLAHDQADRAYYHAIQAGDAELVITIADRYVSAKLLGGQVKIVQGWLEMIPQEWHLTHPVLGLFDACILLITGQFDACAHRLNQIEQMTGTIGRITALRCYIACFQNDLTEAEQLSDQALDELPRDDVGFRPGIYGALGDTYRRNGYWTQAQECYRKLLDMTHAPAFHIQAVHVYGALADLELGQGHLYKAEKYWRKALEKIRNRDNWGQYSLPLIGWVYIRLAELFYEHNQLSEAKEYLSKGIERAELGGDVRSMIAGYLLIGRLNLTQGNLESATQYLEHARLHIEKSQFAHWQSRFERFQLELWLAQDKLRTAIVWSDDMLNDSTIEYRPESEVAWLAMARVLIVKSDRSSVVRALNLIGQLLEIAEKEGRVGIMIESLALEALAHWRIDSHAEALIVLERALRLAESEQHIRLFVDLGLPMAHILQEAKNRDVLTDYVTRLLDAYSHDLSTNTFNTLLETLTPREQEILELLATGLTNPQIADTLFISPETVKKHAGNIYGKLGVSNRTEAAARARELSLLNK